MRDPERISKVLAQIERIWRANPDWRFGQLFVNALEGNDVPYYIEDDVLLARLITLEQATRGD
ncbi:MAG: hypothetical protein A2Y38_19490 [Spirochaetes bacterium GWB1_59_5]|nr:MAG: hypothetical protein A2Y38_19490 [Spirochaetes bacterium GWB1_59_5]